jgi:hypothetical protein
MSNHTEDAGSLCCEDPAAPVVHDGGCLCGDVRYRATGAPVRVTICHCTACQRITGSAYLVEPIFSRDQIAFSGKTASGYEHRSDSSLRRVTVRFCGRCGTSVCLELERFPEVIGLFGGTFDDPNWFSRTSDVCRHIFSRSAQEGAVLPAGVNIFREHAMQLDGTPNRPAVLTQPMMIAYRR